MPQIRKVYHDMVWGCTQKKAGAPSAVVWRGDGRSYPHPHIILRSRDSVYAAPRVRAGGLNGMTTIALPGGPPTDGGSAGGHSDGTHMIERLLSLCGSLHGAVGALRVDNEALRSTLEAITKMDDDAISGCEGWKVEGSKKWSHLSHGMRTWWQSEIRAGAWQCMAWHAA
eukprot:366363-Chlamydomonas_euryale.AAC.3